MFWFVLICFSLFCVPNVDISASDVAESVVDVTVSAVVVTSQTVLLSASSALFLLFGDLPGMADKEHSQSVVLHLGYHRIGNRFVFK